MSDKIKLEIEGLEEIRQALNSMPVKLSQQVLGKANRDILNKIVKPELKINLPYSGDKYKRAIKTEKYKNAFAGYMIGYTTDVYWLRFMEKGTKVRKTKKGYNRGAITSPRPFIQRTLNQSSDKVIKNIKTEYGSIILNIIEKQLASTGKKLKKYL